MKKFLIVAVLAVMVMTLCGTNSFAMTKPISGLRDYNGTYEGAPGTGSVGYSVLYRDNEDLGFISGCNGEGCGSHPGVDIPVASGTNVYATLGGTIITSKCDSGWGGLIIIQSISPYTGETIYVSYAHLRSLYYLTGQTVNEGNVIGQSGGSSSDYCPGNSSNSHLHFQIDKNHSYSKPWWPSNVNQADTGFNVTQYTYNPIVFVTGLYHWTFDQNNFAEYWETANVSSWGVSSGNLWADGNYDPWVWRNGKNISCGMSKPCSAEIAAESNLYKYIIIRMQNNCISNPVKIYFKTSNSDTWDEAKMASFNYGGPATYQVYMGGNGYWSGIIKNIRIDTAVGCSSGWDPNYISVIKLKN